MSYTYVVFYLSRSINTRLDQEVSEPLMYTQFVEIVDSGARAATPFSLKFCSIFIEFLEKKKVSIWLASGQVFRPPLSEFSRSAPEGDRATSAKSHRL